MNEHAYRDPTLRRLLLMAVVLFALLAAADLWRGTGGAAWWNGVALAASAGGGATGGPGPQEQPGPGAGRATGSQARVQPGSWWFDDVRLFDGERVRDRADVLVRDGRIEAVGEELDPPTDAVRIDGAGLTLLPGLIDAHVHAFGDVLRAALRLGVTTELDMFTAVQFAAALRDEQARGAALGRADILSAGTLVTAPGGHGTEYGLEIPTLESPEQADAFVQARVREGSDYIKIVLDTGSESMPFNTLDRATVRAVIEAVHRRGKLAVVHVSRLQDARAVIEDGADGLVHVFRDRVADGAFVRLIRERGAFVVPTLTVIESIATDSAGGAALLEDVRLEPLLGPVERSSLSTRFPGSGREQQLDNALASVRALHAAGVPILAGTDAPNPGTAHGASLHRELELLVRAGLSPVEALAAATSRTADAFGLEDRGRIAPGERADLLLVRGDPTRAITDTRAIEGVWKQGARVDLEAERAAVAEALAAGEAAAAPVQAPDGLVADFESGRLESAFGAGWMPSTDSMMGGKSTVSPEIVAPGAGGSAHALRVAGVLRSGTMQRWAGVMFSPGPAPLAAADLSAYEGIAFRVRGDGRTHVLMAFASNLGPIPAFQTFSTSADWTEVRVRFRDFGGLEAAVLQGILFSGAGEGEFWFEIDDVRLF